MLSIKLSREPNSQSGVNRFEAGHLLKPRVMLYLRNPADGRAGNIRGLIDTGADACHIGTQLAEKIGLQPTGDPAITTRGATSSFEEKPTLVDMEMFGDDGVAYGGFGKRKTVFYLHPYLPEVILGVRGFLDQFAEVRLDYRGGVVTFVP